MRFKLQVPHWLSLWSRRIGITVQWAGLATVYGFLAGKALLQFSRPADFLAFHLPRALGYFGLTTYEFGNWGIREAEGYPDLAHLVMGSLVALTGRISTGNAVNIVGFSVATLCIGLLFRKKISLRWFLTFCLAFPLFYFHIAQGFIDLFAACMLLVGFAGLYGLITRHRSRWSAAVMVAGLTAAMATKMTAWVPAVVFALWGLYLLWQRRELTGHVFAACAAALLVAGVSFYPVKNYLLYGNATHPIETKIVIYTLPNVETTSPVEQPNLPPDMRKMSNTGKFFFSLLELNRLFTRSFGWNAFESHGRIFERDQPGGLFTLPVAVLMLLLILGYYLDYFEKRSLFVFGVSIALVSMMPYGVVLRYSLFIPLVAVFLLSLQLEKMPRALRIATFALFLCSAGIVASQINRAFWTIDTRPADQYANRAAREFWESQGTNPVGNADSFLTIQGTYPATIYWSGPTFNQYRVKEELENNLRNPRIELEE